MLHGMLLASAVTDRDRPHTLQLPPVVIIAIPSESCYKGTPCPYHILLEATVGLQKLSTRGTEGEIMAQRQPCRRVLAKAAVAAAVAA